MGQPARLEQDCSLSVGHRPWSVDQRGWPEGEIELRAVGNGRYCGRFMLQPTPGAIPSLQARVVAVTLADQVGAVLDTTGPVRDS